MKCNQPRAGFELVLPCLFPTTITITPRAPPTGQDEWLERLNLIMSTICQIFAKSESECDSCKVNHAEERLVPLSVSGLEITLGMKTHKLNVTVYHQHESSDYVAPGIFSNRAPLQVGKINLFFGLLKKEIKHTMNLIQITNKHVSRGVPLRR